MKKYIITFLLILAAMISFAQSDPAPTPPASAVSIQGFAKINGVDTVHTGYQSGYGFFDIAGRSWTKKNLAPLLVPASVKTANYTAAVNDLIPVNTTSGSITITLPTAPADKSLIAIKHVIQGSANTVTINSGGTDVFNKSGGATSISLKTLNQGVILQYSSAVIWYVLSDDLSLPSLDLRYVNSLTTSTGSSPTLVNGVLNIPPANSSSGTVTGVSSANSDISVATGTTTPVLTLNSGTGANQIVKRDGSGNINATTVTTNANLTGPVTSVGNTTAINNINGITPLYYDPTSSIQTQLNTKQLALNLTTTGATGTAATLAGNVLNIPTPSLTYGSYTQNGIGETLSDAVLLQNSTASTSSLNQWSPALDFKGTVWRSSATQPYIFQWIGASSGGTPQLQLWTSLNGSTATAPMNIDYFGDIGTNGYVAASGTVATASGFYNSGNPNGVNISIPILAGSQSTSNSSYQFAGSSTMSYRVGFNATTTIAGDLSSENMAADIFASNSLMVYPSVTTPWMVNVLMNKPNLVLQSGSVITNSANLYINSPSNIATNNYPIYVVSGTSYFGGPISVNAIVSVVNGSTSGSVQFSQSSVGGSDKTVTIYCNNLTGTATYTFPTPFTYTPGVIATDQVSASAITSKSTTSVTVSGSGLTGFIFVKGY